jgi:hypothetical protein
MDKIFKSHRELTEQDFKLLWDKGLFVFDTNVLLDLYRLPESAKKDLLSILSNKKISTRLWLPFQAALEFTNNRMDAISDQKNKFTSVRNILKDSKNEIDEVLTSLNKKLNDLQLKKRHSVINPDLYIDENLFKDSHGRLDKFLKELDALDKKQPDVNNEDELKTKISNIFEGKIGNSFTTEELDIIYKEGEARYRDNIPPGYKDSDKKGYYLFENKKIVRKFGDLLVWKEIIKKAKEDGLEYIILVTGDIKEDWWHEIRGRKLGARKELLNEIYFEAPSMKVFNIYDTSNFMQNAKKNLKISVKEQSITETKDLLEFNKLSGKNEGRNELISNVEKLIIDVAKPMDVEVVFLNDLSKMPVLMLPTNVFYITLTEIFTNVYVHSLDKKVNVAYHDKGSRLELSFSNLTKKQIPLDSNERAISINFVKSILNYYARVETFIEKDTYEIKLSFSRSRSGIEV